MLPEAVSGALRALVSLCALCALCGLMPSGGPDGGRKTMEWLLGLLILSWIIRFITALAG